VIAALKTRQAAVQIVVFLAAEVMATAATD
jgi:hypothetical protein